MKIIKFEKPNCVPCTMVQNLLDDKGVKVEKINPFDNPDEAIKYQIGSVPVVILLDEDKELKRSIGYKPEELEEIIKDYLN